MSPLLEDTVHESAEEEDDDLFEDAMSDFPDQFPDHAQFTTHAQQNDKTYETYVDDFEESVSLNEDDGAQQQKQKQEKGDIKRCSSEQALSPTKDGASTQHRRWLSEDIKSADVSYCFPSHVLFTYYFCLSISHNNFRLLRKQKNMQNLRRQKT